MTQASEMSWKTDIRGLSDWVGSWNTIWMSRRMAKRSRGGMAKRSRPFQSARPESASISRRIALATVDLPDPLSPTTASVSPGCSSKETSFSALKSP